MAEYIDLVFDSYPNPELAGFIEVENEHGQSVKIGEWLKREDGGIVLRISKAEIGALKPLQTESAD